MDEKTATRIKTMLPLLNEQQTRLYLAAEANSIGRGGITAISKISGADRNTVSAGIKELIERSSESNQEDKNVKTSTARIRKPGGGRKSIDKSQPGIYEALEKLVDPESFGNPENPLRWTTKSLRNLAKELKTLGFKVSHNKVGELLEDLGYSLQLNQKMCQVGEEHLDRDEQFKYINETSMKYMDEGNPVISVDCKKKENIGNFGNKGAEYSPIGSPIEVLDHDFLDKKLGKAVPYGIYDINNNVGFVNVGISSDTAEFAVASIRAWWTNMGKELYPNSKKIYITADGGGSNGSRNRLWKIELQKLANELNMEISISHFSPGTSKWNKIEHRLFSQISKNWRGRPLISLEVIVNLIASTTTEKGLKVKCVKDESTYETGKKVTDEELSKIAMKKNDFCGNWNYTIAPRFGEII